MDSSIMLTAPEVPLEYMDFLSRSWGNSAVQVYKPASIDSKETNRSMVLQQNLTNKFDNQMKATLTEKQKKLNMDYEDPISIPPWNSDDLKSWIWLQQAMHPEINLDRCFKKKWMPWKLIPLKEFNFQPGELIKKWVKEMKMKRKEAGRLQKAEVHAAISVAGVASALAAMAAENLRNQYGPNNIKEAAMASATALVAAQCAQVAESMGAKAEQLSAVVDSAMAVKNANDILILTATAATSLRGAATLRARVGTKDRTSRNGHITPLIGEGGGISIGFDFGMWRVVLARGYQFTVTTSNGKCKSRLVSVILNREAKVILKIKKINVVKALASTKQSTILDLDAWPEEEHDKGEGEASYTIVMKTTRGMIKLDMSDHSIHKMWIMTVNHMLMLSTTFTGYELEHSTI